MTPLELLATAREQLDDKGGDADVDWRVDDSLCETSNDVLLGFLSAACREYCRRRPARDQTSEVCGVTVTGGGDGAVSLDAAILRLIEVRAAGVTDPLTKRDLVWLDAHRRGWRDETGTPDSYLDDERDGYLRVLPVPADDTALSLTVERLPLTSLDQLASDEEIPDVPREDQDALKYWAAKLVYEQRKDELENPKRAKDMEALFEHYVGPRPDPAAQRHAKWLANRKARTRAYYR